MNISYLLKLSWACKVGQRSQGISDIISMQPSFIFHPKFPLWDILQTFSVHQDTFLILKLLIKFLKELVIGQWSFLAKCIHLQWYSCENNK